MLHHGQALCCPSTTPTLTKRQNSKSAIVQLGYDTNLSPGCRSPALVLSAFNALAREWFLVRADFFVDNRKAGSGRFFGRQHAERIHIQIKDRFFLFPLVTVFLAQ